MAVQDLPIVLYTYNGSPYGHRLIWYLNLRKIPFKSCVSFEETIIFTSFPTSLVPMLISKKPQLQPPVLPRPDLELLGINYRRIPLMTIGRDVYLDTRLIISKLEKLYPASSTHPGISATQNGEHKALEFLLSRLSIEFPGALFGRAAQLMPPSAPVFQDPKFVSDRNQLVTGDPNGKAFTPQTMAANRPAALVEISRYVEFLETTLLADGREFVFKTDGPSLGDIEAGFVLQWLTTMPGSLPEDVIGRGKFPKVFAWLDRFTEAVKKVATKHDVIKGAEAAKLILGSEYAETNGVVTSDPVIAAGGFNQGDVVTIWPMDQAPVNKDSGKLVAMDKEEVVIEIEGKEGKKVRVHGPRHGFKIVKGDQAAAKM